MIDIIIPIYNVPTSDLERCFSSILNQTYSDYKVYIMDDGSDEKTRKYLDDYVQDKNNFVVKHLEHKGVSNARNQGIEISNSKYIAFIDGDDTVNKTFLEEAYHLIEAHNLDVIIGGYNEIIDNKIVRTRLSLPGLHIYEKCNKDKFLEKLLSGKTNEYNKEINDCPTGRIYTRLFRRTSISNIRFDINIHISEDTLFMIDASYQMDRIGIVNKVWYNYYKNSYSVSNGTKKKELIDDIAEFIKEIEKRKSSEKNVAIKNAYQKRICKAKGYISSLL